MKLLPFSAAGSELLDVTRDSRGAWQCIYPESNFYDIHAIARIRSCLPSFDTPLSVSQFCSSAISLRTPFHPTIQRRRGPSNSALRRSNLRMQETSVTGWRTKTIF